MVMHVVGTMNDRDFALLSAYIDGELDAAVATVLEQRLAQEPDLRARLAALQTLQAQLQEVTRAAADGKPVPARIRELLQPQPSGIRSVPHRLARLPGTAARQGLAVAASLAVIAGLLLAPQWQRQLPQQSGDARGHPDTTSGRRRGGLQAGQYRRQQSHRQLHRTACSRRCGRGRRGSRAYRQQLAISPP